MEAIATGRASSRLLADATIAAQIRAVVPPKVAERVDDIRRKMAGQDHKAMSGKITMLAAAYRAAPRPELAAGERVFMQRCAVCHRIGPKGGTIGPQLDGIGNRGLERVIEDVVDPNRNVDQAFRMTTLTLTDGRALAGLPRREEAGDLILADVLGNETRIPLDTIQSRAELPISLMPPGLESTIPPTDLHALLGFLLSQKQAP